MNKTVQIVIVIALVILAFFAGMKIAGSPMDAAPVAEQAAAPATAPVAPAAPVADQAAPAVDSSAAPAANMGEPTTATPAVKVPAAPAKAAH